MIFNFVVDRDYENISTTKFSRFTVFHVNRQTRTDTTTTITLYIIIIAIVYVPTIHETMGILIILSQVHTKYALTK